MTDSTNNSFEEQWQKAFDNTELTPPASVWEKIELGLKPENTHPSKPNFGNKPYYFLGGISVGLLGLFLWFNKPEKESQVVEKQEVKVEKNVLKSSPNISEKIVEVVGGDTNHGVNYINYKTKSLSVEPLSVYPQTTEVETQKTAEENPVERTLTDSVEIIEPLATKSIHSEMGNPTINLPTDQTPYYIKPPIKPQKKSIWDKVKISGGVGVYQ